MTVVDTLARPVRTLACSFTVLGEAVPQGSMVAFRSRNPGPGHDLVTIKPSNEAKLKPWRKQIAAAGARAMVDTDGLRQPLDGPLAVRMVFTLAKPPSYPKTRRSWPSVRPDGDKLARAVADGLTQGDVKHGRLGAVWVDDGRVIDWAIRKVFPGEDPEALDEPGVRIAVWTISEPVQPSLLDGP